MHREPGPPPAHGLYDPRCEHDACGIGFVADIRGRRSRQIVSDALTVLAHLAHRGACGCEPNTGDGAGILVQMPDAFLRRVAGEVPELSAGLPPAGEYGCGLVFLPPDPEQRFLCEALLERHVRQEGQRLLGWRDVPTCNASLGETARDVEPVIRQLFIAPGRGTAPGDAFERKLFLIRKCAEHRALRSGLSEHKYFHLPSLSSRTLVYKGMLTPGQLPEFYPDLRAPDFDAALAMVHSRFSTNTFPSWALAHPFRYLCHNGEINTLRGNINWMRARERLCASTHFTPEEMQRLRPVILEDGSDSAILDNVLEMLVLSGYSLPHAMMLLIPEAWAGNPGMDPAKRDFYAFHACLMEPWDGPASVAFTDGTVIGATLDRNGLRPSRYYVTTDGKVVLASEAGVLDIPASRVLLKGRLQPGRMLLVDTRAGRIVPDEELKLELANARPYGQWLRENLIRLQDLPEPPHVPEPDHATVFNRQQAFGYTLEDLKVILQPMAVNGEEPLGSMGNDAALAVLSERPQLLYNYFKQLFAQVTNPPLDAIREELVTDVTTLLGAEGNLLDPGPESCRLLQLPGPIVDNAALARLKHVKTGGYETCTLPILFEASAAREKPGPALEKALADLCARAAEAVQRGVKILLLSDRGVNEHWAPLPALLAVSAVHQHLVRLGLRAKAGLVVESGEPREVHHFALLLGYGAAAINPYLAFETLDDMARDGTLPPGLDHGHAVHNYIKALTKGLVKVMSRMGISTIQSYRGAQIFEALGLNRSVIERYFTHTASRIEGLGLDEIAREQLARHRRAYPERQAPAAELDVGGQYQWRRDGERHLFNPDTVHKLQYAVRTGSYALFKEYTKRVDDQSRGLCTLRGLFRFRPAQPVPLEEVEPVESLVKRFATGAMSYGSISQEAHETLAIAMNRLGGWSNSGEGGEDEERFTTLPNGDSKCSAIKQVASARFGVTSAYLASGRELQIKIAQGAKPGEGGQLPAGKVYPWIARTRLATPFVPLISPPPHHDIYSIEDLAQLIYDLKNANPRARISVKLVSEVGVGTVAAGVAKAKADVVLISGHDGGTGASPLTAIKHAGGPWELGLAETQQVLVQNGLRGRIIVQTDGQLKTGRDVVIAALLGAEEFGFATSALVSLGCVMMRVCHLDTCPVGIATQNPELRKKFAGKPEHVINFMRFIAQEVREHLAALGCRTLEEAVGRVELLDVEPALQHWKANGLDFSRVFEKPQPRREGGALRHVESQDHGLERAFDNRLLDLCQPALEHGQRVRLVLTIRNSDRAAGTMLGGEVTRWHPAGLPEDTIRIRFRGTAGQSFGAFVPRGLTLELEGDANDYFGKGLSGGRLVLFPPRGSLFAAEENIIAGNVVAYGATSGEIFIRGVAGERFCVRNSGVHAVVEGLGDHGCEYMTGGRVVVLGGTGRNFAAGMSGGIAYVLDRDGAFHTRCNTGMVGLETLDEEDTACVRGLLEKHARHTGSLLARRLLDAWRETLPLFVKVMPRDLKRVLEQQRLEQIRHASMVAG